MDSIDLAVLEDLSNKQSDSVTHISHCFRGRIIKILIFSTVSQNMLVDSKLSQKFHQIFSLKLSARELRPRYFASSAILYRIRFYRMNTQLRYNIPIHYLYGFLISLQIQQCYKIKGLLKSSNLDFFCSYSSKNL